MARLPYLDAEALKPEDRELLKRPIHLHRVLVHNPGAARAFGGLGQYIRHASKLDARLRELAILQVGWLARSPYEWSHHVKIGYDFGVTDADITALIADTDGKPNALEPLAKLVLKGSREIHAGGMTPETFAALRGQLDEAEITDLIVTASFYCAVVRLLASFEIDVEDSYMPYLTKHPLPKD
jgi:alkylhydroperoxidase family enzyme